MEDRNCYVKYNINTFRVLFNRLITSDDVYVKNKLIEMLFLLTYESENMCKKIIDLSIGTIIPEPLKAGTKVKIDREKTGWLSTTDKEILVNNTIDEVVYGVVLSFNGYHSYNAYTIGFPEGTVNLPMESVLDVSSIL